MSDDSARREVSERPEAADHLGEILGGLSEALVAWQEVSEHITAPVDIPSQEDLRIHLVPLATVERLEEYRAERSNWHPVWGIFLGAILGIFINGVTGGQMTLAAWVLVAAFLVMGGLAFGSALRYQRRGDRLREQMLLRLRTTGYVDSHGLTGEEQQ